MTIDEAKKMAEAKLKCMERDISGIISDCNNKRCYECSLNYEQGNMGEQKEWLRMVIKALGQMCDATPKERESADNYIKSISKPIGIEFDEEQEELDFVQPHKKIPVKLTVESGDYISRQDAINSNCYNCSIKTNGGKCSKCDAVKAIEKLPSFIPQSCEVEEIKIQQAYDKGFEDCRQAMLNTISELNAISFYEAQEDSKECYYEIRQAVENLPPVNPQPQIGYWIEEIIKYGRKVFCSECGCSPPFEYVSNGDVYSASSYGVINKTKFCPSCGARMFETKESEE